MDSNTFLFEPTEPSETSSEGPTCFTCDGPIESPSVDKTGAPVTIPTDVPSVNLSKVLIRDHRTHPSEVPINHPRSEPYYLKSGIQYSTE